MSRLVLTVILLFVMAAVPVCARAQAPVDAGRPGAPAADAAQRALEILRDDKRRAALIDTLETITRAGAPAAPPGAPTTLPLQPDSLGAQLIVQVSAAMRDAGVQIMASLRAVNDLPLLWRWLVGQAGDPAARARILDAGWKLALVVGAGLAAEAGVRLVLRRVRAAMSRGAHAAPTVLAVTEPSTDSSESGLAAAEAGESERSARQRRLTGALSALQRLPYLLGRLVIDVVPLLAFAFVGNALTGTHLGEPTLTRLVIVAVIQAYVAARSILVLCAMLVSPEGPRQRLLQVSDWAAGFITRWVRRVAIIGIGGYALAEVGLLFGMYRTAYEALLKLFALVVHLFLILAVWQARVPVARRIHARHEAKGVWATLLNRLSETWHLIAVFYLAALWLVWAVELRNGYVRLINFFLVTAGILIGARLVAIVVLGGLDRFRVSIDMASRHPGLDARLNAYYPIVRAVLIAVLATFSVVLLLESWGFGVVGWLQYTGLGGRALSAAITIAITLVSAVAIWEGTNAGIELHLSKLSQSAQLARAGRLRTLLPMLRTVLLVTILLFVSLMSLSELGVNIAPLLAGAGVVGIAVGFGSQKLVQDLITGLFLLLENAMQVGDVVTLGGLSGTVEALSIRTIRLRALDGSVHIIPFSAVTTVTNQTRDYGFAVLDVSIGLNEEPGTVTQIIKATADEMRADPKWTHIILEPLDVMGVEKFVDLAWVLRVRLKTQPASRWAVGRELNRRIKIRFDELAIESPFTSHRVLSTNPPPPPQPARDQEQPA